MNSETRFGVREHAPRHLSGYGGLIVNCLRLSLLSFTLLLPACNCGVGATVQPDAGLPPSDGDASVNFDSGVPDAGVPDAAVPFDAGPPGELEAAIVGELGDLYALLPDGGSRLLVAWQDAGASSYLRGPRWQPFGSRLAFSDGDRPWILDADGGLTRLELRVTNNSPYQGFTDRVEWSPDGTRLSISGLDYLTDNDAVFLVPTDGGVDPDLVGDARQWAWAADGKSLFFSAFVGTRQMHVTWQYSLATSDAGEVATGLLLDSRGGVTVLQRTVDVSDGGRELVFEARTSAGVFEVLPRNAVDLSARRDGLTLNPAGTELSVKGPVVLNGVQVGFKALRVGLDGGTLTLYDRTTSDPDFPTCLRYLPDGQRLSFLNAGQPPGLRLSEPDGGVTPLLTPPLGLAGELGCLDWHLRRD